MRSQLGVIRASHAAGVSSTVSSRPSKPSPKRPISSERIAFLQRLLERAADRHGLADRLHLRTQHGLCVAGNFSKAQRGILTTT